MLWDVVLVGLPLALFVALAAAFVLVYRRTVDLAADVRAREGVRRSAGEQVARAAAILFDVARRIDAVRREEADAAEAASAAEAGRVVVASTRDAVAGLRPRPGQVQAQAALVEELSRAIAALETATGACTALAEAPADPQAATAVKRGYLGLLHAREAILDALNDLAKARPPAGQPGGPARPVANPPGD